MGTDTAAAGTSKGMVWAGRIMSTVPVLVLIMSAYMKLSGAEEAVEGFKTYGYPDGLAFTLGLVEITCTALYVIPQTSVLGAILLTGYLGGATATHVAASEGFVPPILFGVLIWGGLFLRDPRIRALIPIKR